MPTHEPRVSTPTRTIKKTSAGTPYVVVLSQQVPQRRASDKLYEEVLDHTQLVARGLLPSRAH